MAVVDPKRKYSWWWDSHISPKNSKWLQENLTDMDVKVKQMIKLIEEDADSFARRAEMYYKKRPELMKLVEEFYRAYRALAERYDHATGALRQAHRTMAEAFPNQVPFVLPDDTEPRTPDMAPIRAFIDPDELPNEALGLSSSPLKRNGAFTGESDTVTNRRGGLKHFNDLFGSAEGRARKGLNFHDADGRELAQNDGSHDLKVRVPSESERVSKAEMEIVTLKNALAKLEGEKEAGLLQYQQSLERLSNLELEVSRAREDSKGLTEQASKAEAEVQYLKVALTRLENERDTNFLQYQQCLDKILKLEESISFAETNVGELGERANKAEIEAQSLKQDLARVEAEKEAALIKYEECLKKISDLEDELKHLQEEAQRVNEKADNAKKEVESLKEELAKVTEQKEALALQYQQCLETISSLEHKLVFAEEEVRRLHAELDDGFAKLKGAEEKCLSLESSNQNLHTELDSMVQKMGSQSQELTEKQKELGRLWTCIQEERMRFMEAETAFQTLQHLHSQSQEELRSLASELQNRTHVLKDMEARNQCLLDEVEKVKVENKGLSAVNLSSIVSIENLQDEILRLRETIGELEAEVELRVDQRNALQQEIYCLKEELNELNKKHQSMLEHVESVGLDPENFSLSVKELQDENTKLIEVCERDKSEKVILQEKLKLMENLLEKNALLENSLSDLNAELEGVRAKVKGLEEACHNLLVEKSTLLAEKEMLVSRLQIANTNFAELSDKNNILENSLFDANAELEGLRVKSRSLENSCQILDHEKSGLITEREGLISQLDVARKGLDDLERKYAALKESYVFLGKERESLLQKIKDLQISLDAGKEDHANFVQLSETRFVSLESQIHCLREESLCRKKEYEEELDKAVNAQMEIFVLQKCIQDLEEKNSSLLLEYEKLVESSKLSKKHICNLENENFELQEEMKSLSDQINTLKGGLYRLLERLQTDDAEEGCDATHDGDHGLLNDIFRKLELMHNSLAKTLDENQQLVVENSVLITVLCQLKLAAETVTTDKNTLKEELKVQLERLLVLQREVQKLAEINEELRMKVVEGDHNEEALRTEMGNLQRLLMELQGAHQGLQEQNSKVLNEKNLLLKELLDLQKDKSILEDENISVFEETVSQTTLSNILKNIVSEKLMEMIKLSETVEKLSCANNELQEKIRLIEGRLEDVQTENLHLKKSLEKTENELISSKYVTDQLNSEIENGKTLLSEKGNELLAAEQLLSTMRNERTQLHKYLEDLNHQYDMIKLIREDQERHIQKISEACNSQTEETGYVREANLKLESQLQSLCQELEKTKVMEEGLIHGLEKAENDVKMWEAQAAQYFCELQISSVFEALLEEKACVLSEACENLEDINDSKNMEIDQLKERVSNLDNENGGLKGQLAAAIPVVISLRDYVGSLEHTIFNKAQSIETKDAGLSSDMHAESCQQTSEDQIITLSDGYTELQALQMRLKAVEKAIIEKERLAMQEKLDANSKLEAAMRQIEELKFMNTSRQGSGRRSKHVSRKPEQDELGQGPNNLKQQKPKAEIYEEAHEMMTKDIMLDQVSESSSHGRRRRGATGSDDQMLELWESTDHSSIIDLKVGKAHKVATPAADFGEIKAGKQHRSKNPSIESLVEKELGVDRLEISKRFSESQRESSKRRILERLDSDAQKLANLQITVEDLKRKVEISEKSMKGKGIEYDTVKEQLEETEDALVKLFDANRKLATNAEEGSSSFNGKSIVDPDESGSARRRRISEQARRMTERIGRLQLEVQKIQFLLLKLDDEKESKGRTRIAERRTRVLLRDYLYGGTRTALKRKKGRFCACVQPPTKGD